MVTTMPGTGVTRPRPAASTIIMASRSELRQELSSIRPATMAGLFSGSRTGLARSTNHSAGRALGSAGGHDRGKILLVHCGLEHRHPAGDQHSYHQPVVWRQGHTRNRSQATPSRIAVAGKVHPLGGSATDLRPQFRRIRLQLAKQLANPGTLIRSALSISLFPHVLPYLFLEGNQEAPIAGRVRRKCNRTATHA